MCDATSCGSPQIYTWDGCTVDVFTDDYPIATATDMLYMSDETPMISYLNTHQARHSMTLIHERFSVEYFSSSPFVHRVLGVHRPILRTFIWQSGPSSTRHARTTHASR